MKQFLVTTRIGYIADAAGNCIAKYNLPIGYHNIKDGFEAVEVENQSDLDAIEIYRPEIANPAYIAQETMIADKIRQLAVDALKKEGKNIDLTLAPTIPVEQPKKSIFAKILNFLNPFA